MDLRPWSGADHGNEAVGEIWFHRTGTHAPDPALLLKLLFANEALSIQVHPDDGYAWSIGLPHGKTEAWYILSAAPDAKVAIGLTGCLTVQQLRAAIEDGSIAGMVRWRHVQQGDVVFIPAGTIHAIGRGLVVAEIQQNSDATFRLFDYGRGRELHIDAAAEVADPGPAGRQAEPRRLSDARTLLVACQFFVLERIELAPCSVCELNATGETWLLVLAGHARVGASDASPGDAFFLAADQAIVETGADGLTALVAYVAAEPRSDLVSGYSPKKSMEVRS